MSLGWEALMLPKSCSLFPPVPATSRGEPNSLYGWISCDTGKKLKALIKVIFKLVFSFSFLSIHSGRMLSAPNTPTFTQPFQRPPLVTAPTPVTLPPAITHPMATIPHQPAYRAPTDRIFYLAHTCQPACLNRVRPANSDLHRGKNPLLTPLLYDFRRMTGRRKVNRKVNS